MKRKNDFNQLEKQNIFYLRFVEWGKLQLEFSKLDCKVIIYLVYVANVNFLGNIKQDKPEIFTLGCMSLKYKLKSLSSGPQSSDVVPKSSVADFLFNQDTVNSRVVHIFQ